MTWIDARVRSTTLIRLWAFKRTAAADAAVLGSSTRPIDNCLSDDRSMIAPEGSARQPSAGLPTSDTARTEAFSDGVFAIAITLLG